MKWSAYRWQWRNVSNEIGRACICSMYSQSVVSLSVQILEIPSTRRRWSNNLTVTGKQFHSHLRTQSSLHQIESSRRSVTWHTRPHTALMNRRRNQFGRGNSDRSRSLFTRSTPLGITVSAPWLISCSNRCFPRYFCSRSILGLLNKAPLERRDREDEDENNCIVITYSLKVIGRANYGKQRIKPGVKNQWQSLYIALMRKGRLFASSADRFLVLVFSFWSSGSCNFILFS